MSKCPFNTEIPRNIKIPSVPASVGPDIPVVPTGFSGVKYQMGSAPNSKNSYNQYIEHKYKFGSPNSQNTLTPCLTNKKPLDFNAGNRKCFITYSGDQNMIGRVCTTPGTDGVLYSRESYDGEGVNGNADWVRGNVFSLNYDEQKMNNRTKYNFKTPVLIDKRKTYINDSPYYPIPGRCKWNDKYYKTYPRNDIKNYTSGGFPTWNYPYKTTQLNSREPVEILENFSDYNSYNSDIFFYSGLIFIIFVFYKFSKKKMILKFKGNIISI